MCIVKIAGSVSAFSAFLCSVAVLSLCLADGSSGRPLTKRDGDGATRGEGDGPRSDLIKRSESKRTNIFFAVMMV